MAKRTFLATVAAAVVPTALALVTVAFPTAAGTGETSGLWGTGFRSGQDRDDCGKWRLDDNGFCVADDARNGLEVGVRFRTSRPLEVTGTRFYRVDASALRASLWGPSGELLARVDIPAGPADGWVDVSFDQAVTVQPDQTYTSSYFTPRTRYAFGYRYFADEARTVGPVTALRSTDAQPNGVFCYDDAACGAFPVRGLQATTYWVTPLWLGRRGETPPQTPGGTPTAPPPTPTGTPTGPPPGGPGGVDRVAPRMVRSDPAPGARRAAPKVKVRAWLSERVRPDSVTTDSVRLVRKGGGKAVAARVTYRASRQQVVLRPRSPLARDTRYRVALSPRIRDLAGNRLDQDPRKRRNQSATWRFRTR